MISQINKTKIVILQPMFFPWVGVFEQIYLTDIFVHYTDVQYTRGKNFINRVQIKTPEGIQWLTVPVLKKGKGLQLIKDVQIDDTNFWRKKHLKTLEQNYCHQPFFKEMIEIVENIYNFKTKYISELNIYALEKIANYFKIPCCFLDSSNYQINAKSSEKLLKLMVLLKGEIYITGHGARNYLDYKLFEETGVSVEYMEYKYKPYKQAFGEFTPYVSILDLIANEGKKGKKNLCSNTISWQKFLKKHSELK